MKPGDHLTFLKFVRVLALAEYIGNSTLASFFLWVVSGMNAPRNITGPPRWLVTSSRRQNPLASPYLQPVSG